MDYQIITGDRIEIRRNVLSLLNEGWELQGGAIYNSKDGVYAQAMIKRLNSSPRNLAMYYNDKIFGKKT